MTIKQNITVLLVFITVGFNAFSQNFQIEWQQCFGGTETENCQDIYHINNFYMIVGSSMSNNGDISFNHGGADIWLVKVDETGNILWEKTYGGSSGEGANIVLPSDNGSFYLLGSGDSSDGDISNDPYPGSTDFWILKVDSVGNILWDKILGGNTLDQMWTGISTIDGGVVALGWTGSDEGDVSIFYGFYDMWMVKLNSDGELEWDFTLGTTGLDAGQAIIQTNDGGFLVGGTSSIEEGGNLSCIPHSWKGEAILVKLDEDRNIEWQQCYGGSEHDGIYSLLELNDGYVFSAFTGSSDGDVTGWHGDDDIWVVKIDFDGNIIWQKCLGGSNGEVAFNLFQLSDDGFIIFGQTRSNDGDVSGNHSQSEYDHDIWVVKLNSEGVLEWQQCIGGAGDEATAGLDYGVVKKSDHNFVVAAQSDYGPSFDVACTPHGGNYDKDFWVFEIKDTTTNIISNSAVQFKINVYPNPAKEWTAFNYTLPDNSKKGVIKIIDMTGKIIELFEVSGEEGQYIWDTRSIKPGVYMYSFIVNGIINTDKIVIQK